MRGCMKVCASIKRVYLMEADGACMNLTKHLEALIDREGGGVLIRWVLRGGVVTAVVSCSESGDV